MRGRGGCSEAAEGRGRPSQKHPHTPAHSLRLCNQAEEEEA
jgi:hypothetical protein